MPYFEPEYPIETERLLLRPFELEDFDALWPFMRIPEVNRFLPWGKPMAEAEFRDKVAQKTTRVSISEEGDAINLAAVLKDTGELVGDVTLFLKTWEHKMGEFGWVFDPRHHGNGYATESSIPLLEIAFDQLELHRVIARLDARNAASARVLQKLGLRREAHFVKNEWVGGEWTDELVYAMLVDEWRERRAG
jgi:RimJ/RimL family protein N-acetyltransferase